MPTSIIITSFFISLDFIKLGIPTATINISALFVYSFIFKVSEWHKVTLALLFINKLYKGLPTISLLPIITIFLFIKSIIKFK